MTYPGMTHLNTVSPPEDIERAVLNQMVEDGFGFDEVLANLAGYSKDIFGSDTATGRMRIRNAAIRLEGRILERKRS